MKKLLSLVVLIAMLALPTAVLADEIAADPMRAPMAKTPRTAEEYLAQMTLEQKVYQMFLITPEALTGVDVATRGGDATKAALEQYPVGGLIYFAANLVSREQTTEMIGNTKGFAQELGMPGLFVAVDEEGGPVARVAGKLGTTKFPAMMKLAAAGDPEKIYDAYKTIAHDIAQFGFNVDFAPVADVITNANNTEIGDRAFGTDAVTVSKMVPEAIKGLQDNGIIAAVKHFPGHGNTSVDSHYATTTTGRTLEQMRQLELIPFEAGIAAGAKMVLVSHLTATAIDDRSPASLSEKIITGILRDELGFEGIVITDALRMQAVASHYSPEEIAENAMKAGVDILLMPADFQKTSAALIGLVDGGEIPESRIDESVLRILRAKAEMGILG